MTVSPRDVAHLALPRGSDGDGHERRLLTQVSAISLRAAVSPDEIARQLQGLMANLHRILKGGGLRVRAARRRATSMGAPVGPDGSWMHVRAGYGHDRGARVRRSDS